MTFEWQRKRYGGSNVAIGLHQNNFMSCRAKACWIMENRLKILANGLGFTSLSGAVN